LKLPYLPIIPYKSPQNTVNHHKSNIIQNLFTKIHAFFPPVLPQRRVAREGVDSPGAEVQRRVQRAVQRRPKAPVAAGHGAVERFDAAAAEGDEVLVVGAP
jgi:hypothetical protein